MRNHRMLEGEGYPKPILIIAYQCGPPAFEQCEDCERAVVVETPPTAEGDGSKQTVCGFGQEPLREGRCVLQVPIVRTSLIGQDIGMGP